MKKKGLIFLVTIVFLLLPALSAYGQPPPPPPQDIPIDGGSLLLLFSGIILAVRSFYNRKK